MGKKKERKKEKEGKKKKGKKERKGRKENTPSPSINLATRFSTSKSKRVLLQKKES